MSKFMEQLVNKIRASQENMTEAERIEFWDALKDGYCPMCGRKKDGKLCQCWNNE